MLLREDVLDHSVINVSTARLVLARDVVLTCDGGVWRVAGIDASLAARWRRVLPRRMRDADIHPPLDFPAYRSTALRHPREPLVPLPHTAAEATGPQLGDLRLEHGPIL